jgi:TonB family protein
MDAMITTSGCVASARVVRSVDVRLDMSAVVSVTRWRYTPTLLENQPVPVVMTVSVSSFLNP